MVNKSLGLIEVVGLAAALEAADAAVKAANVELIGYELTKGGGLVLVKIQGDVGAVTAGVEAGRIAASKVNKVWSTLVLPRSHQQLAGMLGQETIGVKKLPTAVVSIDSQVSKNDNEMIEEEAKVQLDEKEASLEQLMIEVETVSSELSNGDDVMVIARADKKPADICNLCNDPACHRKKGDPKITCIYYGKTN